ncbi:MAG: response regulator transcription factor [Candidatus Binatia bacterium]
MTSNAATVFVVDDDPGVRASLGRLLTAVGLSVESFASGTEFLAAIEPDDAGCLLLDLRLKEGSGLDVQDEMRRRGLRLPIIVLTGHGNVPDSVRAMKAGAYDFLQKPPAPVLLVERIRDAMEYDRVARGAALDRAAALARLSVLHPHERDVRSLLVAGGASTEVADDLVLSMTAHESGQCWRCSPALNARNPS